MSILLLEDLAIVPLLAIEMVEDVYATRHLIRGNMPVSAAGDSKVSPKTD